MKLNLAVSSRGQITLPASLRKKLGIQGGDVVIAEEKDGKLFLSPALVVPTRIYTDEEIEQWLKEDELEPGDIEKIENLAKRFPKKK